MPRSHNNRWKLIHRYISDNCTPGECDQVEQWMNKSSANRELINDLKKIWDLTPHEDFDVNMIVAWDRFQQRKKDHDKLSVSVKNMHQKDGGEIIYRVAAGLLIVLFTGFFSWQYWWKNTLKKKRIPANRR